MLRPNKHTNPDQTIIHLSLLLLGKLRKQQLVSYEELRQFAKRKLVGGNVLYLPTLHFLFILGLIEYHRKTDSIAYIGPP